MKTVTINWALIGSIVAAAAGVVGSILTPIYGTSLSTSVQAVLMAVSGLLVLIPTFHVGAVASYNSKLRYAASLHNANTALDGIPATFAQVPTV